MKTQRFPSWQSRLPAILLFFAFPLSCFTQLRGDQFSLITVADGLSQQSVVAICQDSAGYMWFGTKDGLNCYDGHDFKVFQPEAFDSTSLSNGFIAALAVTKEGVLWVGTAMEGVNVYRGPEQGFFRVKLPDVDQPAWIEDLFLDKAGRMWVGSKFGLFVSDRPSEPEASLRRVVLYAVGDSALDEQYRHIQRIRQDGEGRMWVMTRGGLLRANTIGSESVDFGLIEWPGGPWPNRSNASLVIGPEGQPWVLTVSQGLYKYDPAKDSFELKLPHPGTHYRTGLFEGREGQFFIRTFSKGYEIYFPEQDSLHAVLAEADRFKGFHAAMLFSFFQDRSGDVWMGSPQGLYRWSRRANLFRRYPALNSEEHPAPTMVWSIFKANDSIIWVGTRTRGLARLNRNSRQVKWYRFQPGVQDGFPLIHITHIIEAEKGKLWVAGDRGVCLMDPEKETFKWYGKRRVLADSLRLSDYRVYRVMKDPYGYLWASTVNGLNRINLETGKVLVFNQASFDSGDQDEKGGLSTDDMSVTIIDRKGRLWLGTTDGLLVTPLKERMNPATTVFKHYGHNPDQPNGLSDPLILDLLEDQRSGLLYVATANGLNVLDPETGQWKHYFEEDGLVNNYVYHVRQDAQGYLWMSTNRGLSCLDPGSGKFVNFRKEDGLEDYEFNWGAAYQAEDGELFYGGLKGMNSFFPAQLRLPPTESSVVFGRFEPGAGSALDTMDLEGAKQISIPPGEHHFTLSFSLINFQDSRQAEFAWLLEGWEDQWVSTGNRRYATFVGLPPGKYELRIRARREGGKWVEAESPLRIVIRPHFWQTVWFYLLMAVLLGGLVYAGHSLRLRVRIKRIQMMEGVRLEEQERIRREAARDFHDELGHRLTRINFLSENLKTGAAEPDTVKGIASGIQEEGRLLSQGTRDFIWTLDPDQDTVWDLGIRLKEFGEGLLEPSGIRFLMSPLETELKDLVLPMEKRRQLTLILKEGLHNAARHSEASEIRFDVRIQGEELIFEVADNGKGMALSKDEQGYGMKNMHLRASRIAARFEVNSTPGAGTVLNLGMHISGLSANPFTPVGQEKQPEEVGLDDGLGIADADQGLANKSEHVSETEPARTIPVKPIQVAVVEDDVLMRQSLEKWIRDAPDMELNGSFEACEPALPGIKETCPDVVVMDLELPGMSGIDGIERLRKQDPGLDVLLYTVHENQEKVFEALCKGAVGYLTKDCGAREILLAIRQARQGGAPMSAHLARKVVESFRKSQTSPLTRRETEVLERVASGMTFREIGETLFIERETVKSHIKNIYRKLEVSSRAAAIAKAREEKYI